MNLRDIPPPCSYTSSLAWSSSVQNRPTVSVVPSTRLNSTESAGDSLALRNLLTLSNHFVRAKERLLSMSYLLSISRQAYTGARGCTRFPVPFRPGLAGSGGGHPAPAFPSICVGIGAPLGVEIFACIVHRKSRAA